MGEIQGEKMINLVHGRRPQARFVDCSQHPSPLENWHNDAGPECQRPSAQSLIPFAGGRGNSEGARQTLAGDQVVKKAMAHSRTHGEILFEQYLESQGLPFEFEKEHPGKSTRPDYTIEWDGKPMLFDVKDFDPPEKFPTGFGFIDPYTRIREKIGQGRKEVQILQGILLRSRIAQRRPSVRVTSRARHHAGCDVWRRGFQIPVWTCAQESATPVNSNGLFWAEAR